MRQLILAISLTILFSHSKSLEQPNKSERLLSLFNCKYDSDCTENSFCIGNDGVSMGKCKCKDQYILSERNRTTFECLIVVDSIDSPCTKDLQCQINLGAAICTQSEGLCRCSEGSALASDGKCYKTVVLGEYCETNFNCRLGDGTYGFCHDGRCSCNIQHHPSEDKQKCIPSVPLGKFCLTSESCIHTFANCYGGICKCVAGFIQSDNNTRCLQAASQVGDACTENGQCSSYIKGSFCLNEVCSCKNEHHGYGTECVRDAKLGDRCIHDKECILSSDLQYSVRCTGGVCSCIEGVSDESSYGCKILTGSSRSVTPISYLVVVVFMVVGIQSWL